jgi:hypothetical protein
MPSVFAAVYNILEPEFWTLACASKFKPIKQIVEGGRGGGNYLFPLLFHPPPIQCSLILIETEVQGGVFF